MTIYVVAVALAVAVVTLWVKWRRAVSLAEANNWKLENQENEIRRLKIDAAYHDAGMHWMRETNEETTELLTYLMARLL